jgi:Sulfatase
MVGFPMLLGAWGVAVVAPLLDIVGRNPDLLITHRIERGGALAVVLTIACGPPALMYVGTAGASRLRPDLGMHLIRGALGALSALALVQLLPWSFVGWLLAGIIGATVARQARRPAVRDLFRYLAIGPALFVIVFFTISPAADMLNGGGSAGGTDAVSDPSRVVMVVFDELPLGSLLDGDGNIDTELFPSFAALARDSTWYRNTTTVAGFTHGAVPAIFTGRYPSDQSRSPTASAYPKSIFTRLARTHTLNVHETVTAVCDVGSCAQRRPSLSSFGFDAVDLWWNSIDGSDSASEFLERDAAAFAIPTAERFIDSLQQNNAPTLDVVHVELPHYPWRRTASLQDTLATSELPGESYSVWPSAIGTAQGRMRHLLQVQAADTVLGRIRAALEQIDAWKDSTIVVVADHGVSFRTGQPVRNVASNNLSDLAWVPMFVKYPGQQVGSVDDRRAETIDATATIVDVQGGALDDVDGRSLLDPPVTDRIRRFYPWIWLPTPLDASAPDPGYFSIEEPAFADVVARTSAPPGGDPALRIFRNGAYGPFIGQPVGAIAATPADDLSASVVDLDQFAAVDPHAELIPWVVNRGTLRGVDRPTIVAVALNGTFVAFTETLPPNDGRSDFVFLVPPSLVRPGANDMDVFRVDGLVGGIHLTAIPVSAA